LFGIFGWHHFYFGRKKWGYLYMFTLGCFGFGFLIDLFFLPVLYNEFRWKKNGDANQKAPKQPFVSKHNFNIRLRDMYVLWIFPGGSLPHFYAGRKFHGLVYLFTFGLFGVGWVVDFFRMYTLV